MVPGCLPCRNICNLYQFRLVSIQKRVMFGVFGISHAFNFAASIVKSLFREKGNFSSCRHYLIIDICFYEGCSFLN